MHNKHTTRFNTLWSSGNLFAKIITVLSVVCFLVSCSSTTAESIPGDDIPVENINTYMKLYDAPELMNSHKNGDTITLQIINLSKSTIRFPENYHAKVFKKENGKWSEVQNNFYNSGDNLFLPTKESYPLGVLVGFFPITFVSSPITIRVSIAGYLEENEEVRVGAYLDVPLNP